MGSRILISLAALVAALVVLASPVASGHAVATSASSPIHMSNGGGGGGP